MSFSTRTVGIIGVGHVGSHVAFSLAAQGEVDTMYIIDKDYKKALAQARDINDAAAYLPHHVNCEAADFDACGKCDILVMAAGPLPDPEKDRLDYVEETVEILKDICPKIKASGFDGIFVSITNPADVIAYLMARYLDWPRHKFICTGTCLDSARLQYLLSNFYKVNRKSLTAYAFGEHGFSAMIPWSTVRIGGKSLDELQAEQPERYPSFDRAQMLEDTKQAGYLVLVGKGSTEFGIGSAATEVIRAIFHDEKKVLPLSVYLDGQYGQKDIYASVPALLGKDGIEEIIEFHLTEEEQAAFNASCDQMRKYIEKALAAE